MDDLGYRDSTQYRYWSFSPAQVEKMRATAYTTAISQSKTSAPPPSQADSHTLFLSALLELYHLAGSVYRVPSNVIYTSLIFLSRFYTFHSPLIYAPSSLIPSTLYLATKTENHYISLTGFLSALPKHYNFDKAKLLAPEFAIASGLRWAFEIRQPFRALEATVLEILTLIDGTYAAPPPPPAAPQTQNGNGTASPATAPAILASANALARFSSIAPNTDPSVVKNLHGEARSILRLAVPMSEVPFCFTPGQIALGSLWAAGPGGAQIVQAYITVKGAEAGLSILEDCANRIISAKEQTARCKGPAWEEEVKRVKSVAAAWGQPVDFVQSDRAVKDGPGMEKVKKASDGPSLRDSDVFGAGLGSIPARR